jgi:hypothetical protein
MAGGPYNRESLGKTACHAWPQLERRTEIPKVLGTGNKVKAGVGWEK